MTGVISVGVAYLILLFAWLCLEAYLLVRTNVFVVRYAGNDKSFLAFFCLLAFCVILPLVASVSPALRREGFPFDSHSLPRKVAASFLLCIGLVIRVHAILLLRKGSSSDGASLVTQGLYSKVRHPSYLGSILCYSGYSLFVGPGMFMLVCVAAIAAHVIRIFPEERYLESLYGPEYGPYKRKTKLLIPYIF